MNDVKKLLILGFNNLEFVIESVDYGVAVHSIKNVVSQKVEKGVVDNKHLHEKSFMSK